MRKLKFYYKIQLTGLFVSTYRSSSRSRSKSPAAAGVVQFITSFGGESSDEGGVVHGPALPPHLQKNSSKMHRSVTVLCLDALGKRSLTLGQRTKQPITSRPHCSALQGDDALTSKTLAWHRLIELTQ